MKFKKGYIPWNKNKKAPQISKGKKGKLPIRNNKLMIGENHPKWNGGLVELKCLNCNKEFKAKRCLVNKSKYCSKKCMGEYFSKNHIGENHSCWIDGRSYEPYSSKFTEKLKEKIRKRDKDKCQKCGKTGKEELNEFNRKLAVHHIDYDKQNCNEDNLITLCSICNTGVNAGREMWTGYFKNLLGVEDKIIYWISGGTGSFGLAFTKHLLKLPNTDCVKIFSRDEYKQFCLRNELSDPRLKFIIGDVRNINSVNQSMSGADIVINAAALKQLPILEENPLEGIKTNILGSQNVIEAAIYNKVKKALLISSDKAVYPINLYGSTKLCAEKLFIQANMYGDTKFASVRYGNVAGSRGSILEKIVQGLKLENIKITDERMTRFWLSLEQSFELVLFALKNMSGGEVIIPKVPSMKIVDLFNALAPEARKEVVGIRPGEKLHETLLTRYESPHTIQTLKYYVVLPEIELDRDYSHYRDSGKLPEGFEFTSDGNDEWLTGDDIKKMLKS